MRGIAMVSGGKAGTLEVRRQDGVALIRLVGEHDMATVVVVGEEIDEHLAAGDGVVVSLMEAEFIDSSVVRELYRSDKALRKQGRRLVLHVATASIVQRLLEISGLSAALPCTGSLDEAFRLAAAREDAS
jgi:anti-anti-sigma factor